MLHTHATGFDISRLSTAVPRELVHKRAHAEVLLTGWTTHTENRHTVRAQWPRFHSFYWPRDQRFDPMLFVETVRQTLPLLSHTAYGVPFGNHLIWDDFSYQVDPLAMQVPESPAEVVLDNVCEDVRIRNGSLVSMVMHTTAYRDGQRMGTATTRFANRSPALYQRLRGPRHDLAAVRRTVLPLPPALRPAAVGHCLPYNVVLAAGARTDRWQLRADLDHPVLFDHPVDHAPGMLLLEAVRQAAHAHRPETGMVSGMSVTFDRWVELDEPSWVSVAPLGGDRLKITIEQDQAVCLSAEVATAQPAPVPGADAARVPALT
ncbi:ScbA/BarX family gamma-butyrolactone biosynthesis protein [Streptomyces sp. CoH27]|uniref:ScbA/BarX family gamma-butyrolactone biosynthesis protein n=1 Tax=Streptomyces sp. CoH27 TaxID=2875763 RepID=UPI001CD48875|nr:ScbA/BarX family gamma-butyrolactone biosynthesis protein [Streptomyces sp. CoH27]